MAPYHPSPSFTNSEFNSVLFTLDPFSPKHRSPALPLFDINPKGSPCIRVYIDWPAVYIYFSIFFALYLCTRVTSQPRSFLALKVVSPPTCRPSKRFPPRKEIASGDSRSIPLSLSLFPFFDPRPVKSNWPSPSIDRRTKEPWIGYYPDVMYGVEETGLTVRS